MLGGSAEDEQEEGIVDRLLSRLLLICLELLGLWNSWAGVFSSRLWRPFRLWETK